MQAIAREASRIAQTPKLQADRLTENDRSGYAGMGTIMLRSVVGVSLISAAILVAAPNRAQAQGGANNFPSRNIDLLVPFPAGGTADVIARVAAQYASDALGKPIIVQNKAGATGAIASEYVARAPADGYTILMATGSTHTVNAAYRKDLPFDVIKDFAAVALLVTVPNMLVVNPTKVPVKTVAEFIRFLKSNPGKVNFGSSGLGGSGHFAGELFQLMTKTRMTHVPYRGSAPALNDLIAGHVDVMIDNISTVWPQVQQGAIVALAVASHERTSLAPDLPTIAETLPGFEAVSWNGIVAPHGTPKPAVDALSSALTTAVARPDVVKRFRDLGATVSSKNPAQFLEFIESDLARWKRVAGELKLSPPK